MASLSTNASGNRRIMFKAPDGQRKTLYIGKTPVKQAQAILAHVERLVACGIDGSAPPEATAHWLAACSVELRSKLVAVGLAPEAKRRDVATISGLVERYQARSAWKTLKPGTQASHSRAYRLLRQHFDPTTPVRDLTNADAHDLYAALRLDRKEGGMGQATSTANVVAAIVASLFNYAIDAQSIQEASARYAPRQQRDGELVRQPRCTQGNSRNRAEADLRAGSVGRLADHERATRPKMGRRRLGEEAVSCSFAEDGASRRPSVPMGADVPGVGSAVRSSFR